MHPLVAALGRKEPPKLSKARMSDVQLLEMYVRRCEYLFRLINMLPRCRRPGSTDRLSESDGADRLLALWSQDLSHLEELVAKLRAKR